MIIGLVTITGIFFALARIAIINSERRQAEKDRGDALQLGIDALNDRSEEDRKFFETVRQLIVAQNEQDRKRLIEELRNFKFTTTTTTVSTSKSAATTTTIKSSVTPATRSSSTTTTTRPPTATTTTTQPRSPPTSSTSTTIVCVTPPPPLRSLCT